jgi:hypothetical protein
MKNEAKWAEVVSEWRSSGLSAVEFCRRQELSVHSLRHWVQRLKKVEKEGERKVRIARLVREDSETGVSQPEIVIELGGARVLVGRGLDATTLRSVLEALRTVGAR